TPSAPASEATATPGQAGSAGSTVPVTSPSAIRPPLVPGATARTVTVSPSSRANRPSGPNGSCQPLLSSRKEPSVPGPGPETVPEANRSPVRTEAPLLVRCASICAGLQYIEEY